MVKRNGIKRSMRLMMQQYRQQIYVLYSMSVSLAIATWRTEWSLHIDSKSAKDSG